MKKRLRDDDSAEALATRQVLDARVDDSAAGDRTQPRPFGNRSGPLHRLEQLRAAGA